MKNLKRLQVVNKNGQAQIQTQRGTPIATVHDVRQIKAEDTATQIVRQLETGHLMAAMLGGLAILAHLDKTAASEGQTFLDLIDWKKPEWHKKLMSMLLGSGIASGAFAAEGISDETISVFCAEIQIPDAVKEFWADVEQGCTQNRALIAGMGEQDDAG